MEYVINNREIKKSDIIIDNRKKWSMALSEYLKSDMKTIEFTCKNYDELKSGICATRSFIKRRNLDWTFGKLKPGCKFFVTRSH